MVCNIDSEEAITGINVWLPWKQVFQSICVFIKMIVYMARYFNEWWSIAIWKRKRCIRFARTDVCMTKVSSLDTVFFKKKILFSRKQRNLKLEYILKSERWLHNLQQKTKSFHYYEFMCWQCTTNGSTIIHCHCNASTSFWFFLQSS